MKQLTFGTKIPCIWCMLELLIQNCSANIRTLHFEFSLFFSFPLYFSFSESYKTGLVLRPMYYIDTEGFDAFKLHLKGERDKTSLARG